MNTLGKKENDNNQVIGRINKRNLQKVKLGLGNKKWKKE